MLEISADDPLGLSSLMVSTLDKMRHIIARSHPKIELKVHFFVAVVSAVPSCQVS